MDGYDMDNENSGGGAGGGATSGVVMEMTGEIMLEVVPPSKRASPDAVGSSVEKISSEVNKLKCISCINIPEVIEENHVGVPYYRNIDTRIFGKSLLEKTGRKIIVNKVIAHLPKPRFETWVKETVLEYGIKSMVFVGASREPFSYIGPSVVEANQCAVNLAKSGELNNQGLEIGNILIPGRENEVERSISKTKAGCSFFTTQLMFQPESFSEFAKEYCEECTKKNLEWRRNRFFLSFAPARSEEDIEFFRWLGCDIPPSVIHRLQESGGDIGKTSIDIAKETLSDILVFIEKNKLEIPIALNVEVIFMQNLPLAMEMIKSLSPLMVREKP